MKKLSILLLASALAAPAWAQSTTPGAPVTAGVAQQVTDNPTVTASSYTSGKCLGGFRQVTVGLYNGQTGFLTNFRVFNSDGTAPPTLQVYVFDASPTSSKCDNTGNFSLASPDAQHMIFGPVSITLASPAAGANSFTFASTDLLPPRPFVTGGSFSATVKTIWYALVAGSTFTPLTTTGFSTRTGVLLN